ncbi:hypothetical protein NDU88_007717 [Pleurodeles waltl]|uniref:Uncharacterized protein n=1 Tax=Pleurodeles waltl TaxID=8319 RepID=A0AAV7N667_PLEWA|nr:hypothetical protein NDU88_007717 [Pleurodeles waltl]
MDTRYGEEHSAGADQIPDEPASKAGEALETDSGWPCVQQRSLCWLGCLTTHSRSVSQQQIARMHEDKTNLVAIVKWGPAAKGLLVGGRAVLHIIRHKHMYWVTPNDHKRSITLAFIYTIGPGTTRRLHGSYKVWQRPGGTLQSLL